MVSGANCCVFRLGKKGYKVLENVPVCQCYEKFIFLKLNSCGVEERLSASQASKNSRQRSCFISLSCFSSRARLKCLTLARQKGVKVYFSRFLAAFNCQYYLGIFILNQAKSRGAPSVGLRSFRLRNDFPLQYPDLEEKTE